MNRRGFIGTLTAAVAGVFMPRTSPASAIPITFEAVSRKTWITGMALNGSAQTFIAPIAVEPGQRITLASVTAPRVDFQIEFIEG